MLYVRGGGGGWLLFDKTIFVCFGLLKLKWTIKVVMSFFSNDLCNCVRLCLFTCLCRFGSSVDALSPLTKMRLINK